MSIEELRSKNQGLVETQQSSGVKPNSVSTDEADTWGYIIDGSSTSTDSQTESTELVSEDDAVVGGELDINPFSMVDDSAIEAEYNSLDVDNDGVVTHNELLSWDGIIEGISGTLDNLKDVFTGLGLKVSDSSTSAATSAPSEGESVSDAAGGTEQALPVEEGTEETPVEGTETSETEQVVTTEDGTESAEGEEVLPDAVMIEGLKDATKEDFREVAKQSEEFWSEVEDIGLDKVFSLIDKDEDGKVSEEELKEIAELDSEDNEEAKNSISIDDVKKAIENDKAAKEAEAKAAEAEASKGSDESDTKVNNTQSPRTNAASGAGGAGGSSGVGGSSGSYGGGSTSQANQPTGLDAMSIEELEAEKTSREGILNEKREELNGVYSGDNAAVQAAEEDMEAAKEAYDKLVEEDDNIPDELKEEKQQIEEDMTANQQEIDETKVSINDTEAEITDLNTQKTSVGSELSSLNDTLSSLESKKSDDDSEKNAEIDEKIASVKQQIKEKGDEEDKLDVAIGDAEEKLGDLQEALSTLEEEKAELEEAKLQNQEDILAAASPETKEALKEAMTKYNEAQAKVEETKESEASRIQGEIDTAQADVEEVSQKLTEKKNVEKARENGLGTDDIVEIAKKYLGMNESDGSYLKFTNGEKIAWCAAFVTYVVKEAMGEDTPEGFGSPSVATLREWGDSNGRYQDISNWQNIKPGDVMIQEEDGASHTGIITSVDPDGTIHTIEGNTSDMVAERTYNPNDPDSRYHLISGFISM